MSEFSTPVPNLPRYDDFRTLEDEGSSAGIVAESRVDPNTDKSWFRRHRLGLSMGALVAGTVVSIAVSPTPAKSIDKIMHEPKWLYGALAGSTTTYLTGVAMVAKGSQKGIENPFKIKESLSRIQSNIYNNPYAKPGFWLGTTGVVGNAGLVSAVILNSFPHAESIAPLASVGFDLARKLVIREKAAAAIRGPVEVSVLTEQQADPVYSVQISTSQSNS